MTIENWWPKLAAEDQQWLIRHNGERVPTDILEKVAHVGGLVCTPTSIIGETRPDGFYFSDEAVDWIEAIANGETPTMPPRAVSAIVTCRLRLRAGCRTWDRLLLISWGVATEWQQLKRIEPERGDRAGTTT